MHHSPTFLRSFFQLATVNVLSNLMVPLAGLLDVAFLGHLPDIHPLAGVALATVLVDYIYWTFGFLRMGTTGTTAQAIGRGDRDAVLLIGLRNVILALGFGLAIVILQQPLRSIGFSLLSADPAVKAAGQAYYDALIWGAPATLTNFVIIGWFLGQARSRSVLLLSAVGNSTKIGLDYLCIVHLGWSSTGAGLATAISQFLMLVAGILLICREIQFSQVRAVASKLLDLSALKATFTLNREILIRTYALMTAFALFTNLSSTLGTVILAANAVLLHVVTLAAYFIDGLAFATESFAGIFQGKGNRQALVRLVQVSGGTSLFLGLGFAIAFNLSPTPLFRLLTSHAEITQGIENYVLWLLPVLGFGSLAYMLDCYFLGLTNGLILRNSSLIAALLGFAPGAIVAWKFQSNHLLWLALSLFMAARALTLGLKVPGTLRNRESAEC
jgi:MATE family multidrug resistance protein